MCILLLLAARQFDQHLYVPFLSKAKIAPVKEPVFAPHLFKSGLIVAGLGIIIYVFIGWLVF